MRRRLLALAAAAVLVAGGCGIPDDSGVTVVGNGPTEGGYSGDDGAPPVQYTRDAASDPAQLVDYYLEAAAGDSEDPEGAIRRVKAFLAPAEAENFKPGPDIKVYRLAAKPLYNFGEPDVTLSVQEVGTLKGNGVLEPAADPSPTPTTVKISVGTVKDQSGLFITDAPQALMLTDDAVRDFYQRRTIYFWNSSYTALVPDVRYISRSVPTVQQPTTMLGWLAGGPASWLGDSVQPLPPNTSAPGNVPAIVNNTLQVTLNAPATPANDDKTLDRLRKQIQWSLKPMLPQTLELKVGHQDPVRYSGNDYISSNPSSRLPGTPDRFVVYNGTVRRLAESAHAADPVPVLRPADNKGISVAAMSSSGTHTFAAVVTGTGRTQRLRAGSAAIGEQGDLKDVTGLSGTLGRPQWAVTADGDPAGAIGLITVNGRVYRFAPGGGRARPVEWHGDPGRIDAISVAPDGQREALGAGGELYRTVLDTGDDGISFDAPQQLLPPTLETVAAVAWSSEGWLTVAGVRGDDNRVSILDVSVDGVLQSPRLPDIGDKTVSYLTAYPTSPATSSQENSGSVSYTAAGAAWDALSTPVPIKPADVAGTPPNPPAGVLPTAPFFLD